MNEPATAVATAADVRARRRTATAVIEDALDRIARLNGPLNALCEVRPRAALAAAAELDRRIAAGDDPGPLAGVPVAVKDVVWEAGVETTDGSRALLGFRPEQTATLLQRLLDAGAIVVGRSNIPEFCYRGIAENELYGRTSNAWDVGRVPGGSSGGAGSAVAAGMVPLAIGSDGGGSIRIPASLCGVVGMKATFGLVPREPQWPGWYSLTHLGPLTFTVADCALMLAVMAGPDPLDATSLPALADDLAAAGQAVGDLRGLRIAYSEDLGYLRVDAGVRERFRETVARFRELGAELVEDDPGLANPIDTWNTIACVDNLASEGPLLETGRVGADARELIEAGRAYTGADYVRARNEQAAYASAFGRFMERYDLFLTPAMEVVAFEHGTTGPPSVEGRPIGEHFDDWCHFCYPANLTGAPAISVPMGTAEHDMPVGLQLTGRRLGDATVLRAAAAWERLAPWPRPPIATSARPAETPEATPRDELRAGMRVAGEVVLRAYSPSDGELVIETEPAA